MTDVVAPTVAADGSLPVCSPSPHPGRKGIAVRRRPATMAVKRSDMQAACVTLVRGKNWLLVKSVIGPNVRYDNPHLSNAGTGLTV